MDFVWSSFFSFFVVVTFVVKDMWWLVWIFNFTFVFNSFPYFCVYVSQCLFVTKCKKENDFKCVFVFAPVCHKFLGVSWSMQTAKIFHPHETRFTRFECVFLNKFGLHNRNLFSVFAPYNLLHKFTFKNFKFLSEFIVIGSGWKL